MRTILLHDTAAKLSKAKVHAYSESALCLEKTHEPPHSLKKWYGQIGWFIDSKDAQELNGIDGEPVEFEWNTFAGHTILDLLHEIHRKMTENRIKPEQLEDRIIFMSMYNDIGGTKEGNFKKCIWNSSDVEAYAHRSPKRHWSFLGPGTEEKRYGTHTCKPEGLWNCSAEMMMLNLGGSGHPVFRATSALDRGTVDSYRFTTMVTCRMQSCCFAQLLPSTSSVPTERSRIGAKNQVSRSQIRFVFQHGETQSEDE